MPPLSPFWNHRLASIGVSVNDTNREKSVADAITRPKSRKIAPMNPVMNAIGVYTTTSTRVIAIAAMPISERPLIAASFGSSPRWRWRAIFSSTTIESSTRMPTVRARPIRLMKLNVMPSSIMTPNVEIRLVGIASKTITVLRNVWRNTSSTRPVSNTASIRLFWTSLTLSLMYGAESHTSRTESPLGNLLCSSGSALVTALDTATVLALDVLEIISPIAGSLLVRCMTVVDTYVSTTVATSRMRTELVGPLATRMFCRSRTDWAWVLTRIIQSLSRWATLPAGTFRLSDDRAWVTCRMLRPYDSSLRWSTWT